MHDETSERTVDRKAFRDDEDPFRRALDDLERVGDAAHIGNGYWLPTPFRLIDFANDEQNLERDVLVLGTNSTRSLRLMWHPKIRRLNVVRSIAFHELPDHVRGDDFIWQRLDDWLGIPPETLTEWADALMTRAKARLVPASQELAVFEFYYPTIAPRGTQRSRWIACNASIGKPVSGLTLCRMRYGTADYAARYWIGTLERTGQGVRAIDEAEVRPSDAMRLMYALDLRSGCPTRAYIGEVGAELSITLFNRLPGPERRLILAVARREADDTGQFWNRYLMPRKLGMQVIRTLGELGMKMFTES